MSRKTFDISDLREPAEEGNIKFHSSGLILQFLNGRWQAMGTRKNTHAINKEPYFFKRDKPKLD